MQLASPVLTAALFLQSTRSTAASFLSPWHRQLGSPTPSRPALGASGPSRAAARRFPVCRASAAAAWPPSLVPLMDLPPWSRVLASFFRQILGRGGGGGGRAAGDADEAALPRGRDAGWVSQGEREREARVRHSAWSGRFGGTPRFGINREYAVLWNQWVLVPLPI